jgi:drug/metabolite transporter (DMT)-like permease
VNFLASIPGILTSLAAAVVWGVSDFSGGYASRKGNSFHVLSISGLAGVFVLILAELVFRESFPAPKGVMWAMLAGLSGTLGLSTLYFGLATRNSATVAPVSAVLGAALPVAFSYFIQGAPAITQLIGFFVAFAGIWLVSQTSDRDNSSSRSGLLLGIIAGVGFSGFFILISQADPVNVITPLIISRSTFFTASLLLLLSRKHPFASLTLNPIAILAGMLDAGGNVLFMVARQLTRLDIAVVLSSIYPAFTVLLTALIVKEKITRRQWVGVVVCLAAIILITI